MGKHKKPTREQSLMALAKRLEAGSGPDRELDLEIHRLVNPDDEGEAPAYTRQPAAALILFPDRSPRKMAALAIAAILSESN